MPFKRSQSSDDAGPSEELSFDFRCGELLKAWDERKHWLIPEQQTTEYLLNLPIADIAYDVLIELLRRHEPADIAANAHGTAQDRAQYRHLGLQELAGRFRQATTWYAANGADGVSDRVDLELDVQRSRHEIGRLPLSDQFVHTEPIDNINRWIALRDEDELRRWLERSNCNTGYPHGPQQSSHRPPPSSRNSSSGHTNRPSTPRSSRTSRASTPRTSRTSQSSSSQSASRQRPHEAPREFELRYYGLKHEVQTLKSACARARKAGQLTEELKKDLELAEQRYHPVKQAYQPFAESQRRRQTPAQVARPNLSAEQARLLEQATVAVEDLEIRAVESQGYVEYAQNTAVRAERTREHDQLLHMLTMAINQKRMLERSFGLGP